MNREAFSQAVFLLISMSAAGAVHIVWLRSSLASRFGWPVDGGLTFRGRRLFGDNKRVCGFMVLPPSAGLFFMLLGNAWPVLPEPLGDALWPLSAIQYAGLGLACGFAFMAAELPNSFLKRQFGIDPGEIPARGWLRLIILLVDRLDSIVGVLLVLSFLVPVSRDMWFWILASAPVIHAGFSVGMHMLHLKTRAL